MKLEFDFEISDWIAFQQSHKKSSSEFKRAQIGIAAIVPVVFCLFVLVDFVLDNIMVVKLLIGAVLSLLWGVYIPKWRARRTDKELEKEILSRNEKLDILGHHKLQLNEEELICILPKCEQRVRWVGITQLKESATHYFLYNATDAAIVIPKDKAGEQLEELDNLLKAKIS